MALPKARPRGGVLTSSAAKAGDRQSEYAKRKAMTWQQQALAYVDLVPELSFGSRFYAKMLKQARYYPARLGGDGQLTEITDGAPVDLLRQIRDPGGGTSQLNAQYGRLAFITGEGVLFGRDLETPRERWSYVWTEELKIEMDGDVVTKIIHMPNGESGKKTEYSTQQARAYPMWTPHPRLSGEADSPMRAVLDIAEELIALTAAVRSTAVTRLTNGILFMPIEASPGGAEADADEDPEEDPFASDLGEHMSAQTENPGDAEHRVPLVSWMSSDLIDKPRHMQLHDPATDYVERELRKEAIERLALGLDMPPEALTGLGSSNHWSAIQILGDMWKSHGLQVALQFASDLGEVFLRPALADENYPGWEDVVVAVDGSQVVTKADRSDDARTGIREGAIGPRGWRKMTNTPEDYAPDEDERAWMLELRGKPVPGSPAADQGAPSSNGSTGQVPGEPPPPGPEGDSGRRTRVVAAAFREMGAAEYALMRCRELAGMRLRNQRVWKALESICLDCAKDATGKPHSLVAHAIGPERLRELHLDPMVLVRGGADTLRELLTSWGYPERQADALAEMVELFAARSLFEERAPSLPSGFEAQLVRTRELSGVAA